MIRPAMLITFLLAVSLTLTLFVVKYQVQDMEDQLTRLNRSITEDKQAIHVLKAEWSHLNDRTGSRPLPSGIWGSARSKPARSARSRNYCRNWDKFSRRLFHPPIMTPTNRWRRW